MQYSTILYCRGFFFSSFLLVEGGRKRVIKLKGAGLLLNTVIGVVPATEAFDTLITRGSK